MHNIELPSPDIKTKYENISSAISSQQIFGKNSESKVNKIAMKSFSKNLSFGVDFKL